MRPQDSIGLGCRLDRALHGDRLALAELVRAETPRLHGIAWRITGDATLAEDVVQETFLRIIKRRPRVRRKGAAAAWLSRVAAHAAIDLMRRRIQCPRPGSDLGGQGGGHG